MKKYQVIRGHGSYLIGESDTLRGAKIIATKNSFFYTNFEGLCKPDIYLSKDIDENRRPLPFAEPVAIWNSWIERWV